MQKKWVVVAGCAVAAAIVLWLTAFRPSEEERVRQVQASALGKLRKALLGGAQPS